ncbi:MBL fold metallo-hydrolase [Actinokineospora soli]|uniref:MBL fold metallo-hydrolase n=1 Tax=Actinokineospora soli TaxID=1048753 RepID=A0ABW2TX17_9PSEU
MRVDHVVTSGTFSLDGGTWEVDNNVWIVGDDREVVIIDPAHDADEILGAIADRDVLAILCTHAHDDHINAAEDLATATDARVYLHPADEPLWRMVYPDDDYDPLHDGQTFTVAGVDLVVMHTPGHAPGAVCFHAPDLGVVFTGDTLFQGGPGATGRSYSDYDTIVDSITERLFALPPETVVHTGHGDSTTIGEEAARRADWGD